MCASRRVELKFLMLERRARAASPLIPSIRLISCPFYVCERRDTYTRAGARTHTPTNAHRREARKICINTID